MNEPCDCVMRECLRCKAHLGWSTIVRVVFPTFLVKKRVGMIGKSLSVAQGSGCISW